jgi:general nucleoside transport system permease protein
MSSLSVACATALRRSLALTAPEYLWAVVALVGSLVIVGPLAAIDGASPLRAYSTMFEASFSSLSGLGTLLQYSVPLILVGLGVAVPLRLGLFNIGGEGQLLAGALAAVVVGIYFDGPADVPGSFLIPLVCATLAGAALGAIAGALKAWRGVNEIITTIMLNFFVVLFVQYLVDDPLKDPALPYASTPAIDSGYGLGRIGTVAQVPTSIFVALVVAVVVAYGVHFTRAGWRLQTAGANPLLAARQGFSVPRLYLTGLLLGGALAGLGGGAELVGNQDRVVPGFSPGWGFDAIAIAVLARGNMLAVVPYAIFYAFVQNGAELMEINLGIPGTVVDVLVGAPVIIVAAILGYRGYRQAVRAV